MNSGSEDNKANERGVAAIMMVVMVVTVFMSLAGALSLLTRTGYDNYHFSKNRAQALSVAEAGIAGAIREIKGNTDYDGDGGVGSISNDGNGLNNPTLTYSDGAVAGSYWVQCSRSVGYRPDGSPYYAYSLVSTGSTPQIERVVSGTYDQDLSFSGFDYAVGYTTSYEDDDDCDIGEVNQLSSLPVPNMDFLRDNADYVYESGLIVGPGETLTGVYYVRGDVYFDQGVTLYGSIIVEDGTLIIDRDSTIDPSQNPDFSKQNYPAVVVAGDGAELNIDQNTTIVGLVYSSGDIYVDQGCEIQGSVVGDSISIDREVTISLQAPLYVLGFGEVGLVVEVSLEAGTWQST